MCIHEANSKLDNFIYIEYIKMHTAAIFSVVVVSLRTLDLSDGQEVAEAPPYCIHATAAWGKTFSIAENSRQ